MVRALIVNCETRDVSHRTLTQEEEATRAAALQAAIDAEKAPKPPDPRDEAVAVLRDPAKPLTDKIATLAELIPKLDLERR